MGPEGLQGLLRRGQPREVEGARRHRAREEVEGTARCADRRGMFESLALHPEYI